MLPPAGHDAVVVLQVGVGVKADGGDVKEGFVDGAVVEGFDVGEGVDELEAGDANFVGGEAVEHEGVVGVGAVGDLDLLYCGTHGVAVLQKAGAGETKRKATRERRGRRRAAAMRRVRRGASGEAK